MRTVSIADSGAVNAETKGETMSIILTAENLSKIYLSGTKAVDSISFSLNRGGIFGFLGPNGAGKTTTVKLLCGMLTPTSGKSQVLGLDPARSPETLHQKAGVVTEHAQMYDHLTGMENLMFYGTLFGMDRSDCAKKASELLRRLDLLDAQNRKLSTYSTGMRQRLSLARALLHSPEILFLDEPTSGLDPESAQNVNALIGELAAEGKTVFLCTHQLRYAEEICTCYGLMDKGKLFATGTLDELRSMVSGKMAVRVKASCVPQDMQCKMAAADMYDIPINEEAEIPLVVKRIVDGGGNIYAVTVQQPTLEDIYFTLIQQNHGKDGETA